MKISGKNILLISPESWNHIYVSKHHYAIHLASKGNIVVFANPPKNKWSLFPTEYHNLSVIDYPRFPKGLRKYPKFISQRIIKNKLEEIEKLCQLTFDIVWSFDNSVFFDFSLLNTYNISHIVDLNQNFELKKAASTADICFYTTELIGEKMKKFQSKSYFVNHGYNEKNAIEKIVLPGNQTCKILYAGNLNMPYIDWCSIEEAVRINTKSDFIFVGPYDPSKSSNNVTEASQLNTFNLPNTYLIGKVDANQLINYYEAADILIICYQEKHHADQSNPHKMMEYLGSRKPIVSTLTQTFIAFDSPIIEMCKFNHEFAFKLYHVIENYSSMSAVSLADQRMDIAKNNSYDKQIERIEKLIAK